MVVLGSATSRSKVQCFSYWRTTHLQSHNLYVICDCRCPTTCCKNETTARQDFLLFSELCGQKWISEWYSLIGWTGTVGLVEGTHSSAFDQVASRVSWLQDLAASSHREKKQDAFEASYGTSVKVSYSMHQKLLTHNNFAQKHTVIVYMLGQSEISSDTCS